MAGESGFLDNYTHEQDVWSPNSYVGAMPDSGIVIHHMAGTDFYAAGRRFKDRNQQASAHYSVGDGIWCQHVSEDDGAWHAGADWPNRHTIGIENVNSAYGEPWTVSDETFSTCAALMADIAYRHGWEKLERNVNVWGHRDFSATACPGSLYDRLDELCDLANEILDGEKEGKVAVTQVEPNLTDAQLVQLIDHGEWFNVQFRNGNVLDVKGGTAAGDVMDGREVWQYEPNGTDAQLWRFDECGIDGAYWLVPKIATSKTLDVIGGKTAGRGNTQLHGKQASLLNRWAQAWRLIPTIEDGWYSLINAKSLWALDANPCDADYS